MAGRLGISRNTIDAFEQGTQRASAKQLFDIAEVLELQIEGLFSTDESFEPNKEKSSLPPEAQGVADHYDALSETHRSVIFTFLIA